MVACQYCAKRGLECKLSSLKKKCGNCIKNGVSQCEPVQPALPNFSKIDKEMSRLEKLEEEAEEAEEAAISALQAARAKLSRLRKQKKFLKRREQGLVDDSLRHAEELEQLEALEALSRDADALSSGLMEGTLALDWSAFPPPVDPDVAAVSGS